MKFFPCKVCEEKDRRIAELHTQIQLLTTHLELSRDREQSAVDQLLNGRGIDAIKPAAKMSRVDADQASVDLFSIFKDEDDKGDGTIQEADHLNDRGR